MPHLILFPLTSCQVWIVINNGRGGIVDNKKLLTCPPFGTGAYPPMGTPSPPYPPLYMSFCQFRGDNPLYNGKINFRKNCSPTHKWGGGIIVQMYMLKGRFGQL